VPGRDRKTQISFDEHGKLKTCEKASEFVVEECHPGKPKTRA
jgi:hypothetical protein